MTAKQDLESKYIATLLGCVSGDCLGSEFEFRHNTSFKAVVKKILHDGDANYKLYYTDDTALTRATCQSLFECGTLKPVHLAWSLTQTFLENTKRGYAMGARCLFNSFKKQCDREPAAFEKNPYQEPTSLFDGSGSLGNGSGMRISPIALWTINDSVDIMTLTGVLAISLTHSNEIGIIGGLQQCFAIRLALESNWQASEGVSESFCSEMFDKVINYVEDFENNGLKGIVSRVNKEEAKKICENYEHFIGILLQKTCKNITDIYSQILKETKKFYKHVEEGNLMDLDEFHKNACNCGVKADESIPVALFAFLVASNKKCEKEVDGKIGLKDSFSLLKPIDRVILYAISLGGDTDTIGSMAGAIAGAFYGYIKNKTISSHVVNWCEGTVELEKLASELYFLRKNKEVNEKKEETAKHNIEGEILNNDAEKEDIKVNETPNNNDARKEDIQVSDIKKEETVKDNAKEGEIQNNNGKIEDTQTVDTKKEETEMGDTKKEDTQTVDTKKEETQMVDTKKEETQMDDTKKEDTQMNDSKKEEIQTVDTKKEETQMDDTKKEEIQMVDTKKEETEMVDTKNEETIIDNAKKEENQKTDA